MQRVSAGDIASCGLFSLLVLLSALLFVPMKILSYPVTWIRRNRR
jgi:hypothetical protein